MPRRRIGRWFSAVIVGGAADAWRPEDKRACFPPEFPHEQIAGLGELVRGSGELRDETAAALRRIGNVYSGGKNLRDVEWRRRFLVAVHHYKLREKNGYRKRLIRENCGEMPPNVPPDSHCCMIRCQKVTPPRSSSLA